MFESWIPPTEKPGMPLFQKAAASSSVDRICASGAVPAGCTGEKFAWSDALYAGTNGVGTAGSGAEPVWLYRRGFSCGTVPSYFALCCAKPAVTAVFRLLSNAALAALFAAMAPLV